MYLIYFLRQPLIAAALAMVALFIVPAACVIVNDPRPAVEIPRTPPRADGCVMFCSDLPTIVHDTIVPARTIDRSDD